MGMRSSGAQSDFWEVKMKSAKQFPLLGIEIATKFDSGYTSKVHSPPNTKILMPNNYFLNFIF